MQNFYPKNKKDIVYKVLGDCKVYKNKAYAKAYAPANFALIKYWGKESEDLMIPKTGSLSVSLGEEFGTTTEIFSSNDDIFILNGEKCSEDDNKFQKLFKFIDLFRSSELKLKVVSHNDLSTGAGLATSASGFASLVLTLNELFFWNLEYKELSILARLGSVSASRSVYKNGFVELIKSDKSWQSFSKPLNYKWKGLYVGILQFNNKEKSISSTKGMKVTVENSVLYKNAWQKQVEYDMKNIHLALKSKNWKLFQNTVQGNALAMHATAISAGVIYWSDKTLKVIKKILDLQEQGLNICFTEDAGEHIKIISNDREIISKNFSDAVILELF